MSLWGRLWRAITHLGKNRKADVYTRQYLLDARKFLTDYDDLYCQRTKVNPMYSAQAAEIVNREGRRRAPGVESEVRALALVVERLLGYLEAEHAKEKS